MLRSGVGALAVVRALLLASAALAAGLAHGVLLIETMSAREGRRSVLSNVRAAGGKSAGSEPGQEPLGVDDDPGDLAGADDLAVAADGAGRRR